MFRPTRPKMAMFRPTQPKKLDLTDWNKWKRVQLFSIHAMFRRTQTSLPCYDCLNLKKDAVNCVRRYSKKKIPFKLATKILVLSNLCFNQNLCSAVSTVFSIRLCVDCFLCSIMYQSRWHRRQIQ